MSNSLLRDHELRDLILGLDEAADCLDRVCAEFVDRVLDAEDPIAPLIELRAEILDAIGLVEKARNWLIEHRDEQLATPLPSNNSTASPRRGKAPGDAFAETRNKQHVKNI